MIKSNAVWHGCANINNFDFKFITSISTVSADAWNSMVQDQVFASHEFLSALETSGSASEINGWQPNHLVVYVGEDLVGIVPLYLKTNSYGEYVFDFQWANAYHQSGIHYYPKLVTSIPFTPCTGERMFILQKHRLELIPRIIETIIAKARSLHCSSWHLLFPSSPLDHELSDSKLLRRNGVQYHWFNKDYRSFDDFLGHCRQKKRKNIRRERKTISDARIKLSIVEGLDADGNLWMQFFKFYQRTYIKRSGHAGYLNWSFFEYIGTALRDRTMFVVASLDNKVIGMSLFFKGNDTLYGRYWGAEADYEFLHFEACYYQGIEYCIRNKIAHFDAGAQGEHKIQRGFEPIETCSYHWINHPQFEQAISEFLIQEKAYVDTSITELSQRLPFKS